MVNRSDRPVNGGSGANPTVDILKRLEAQLGTESSAVQDLTMRRITVNEQLSQNQALQAQAAARVTQANQAMNHTIMKKKYQDLI